MKLILLRTLSISQPDNIEIQEAIAKVFEDAKISFNLSQVEFTFDIIPEDPNNIFLVRQIILEHLYWKNARNKCQDHVWKRAANEPTDEIIRDKGTVTYIGSERSGSKFIRMYPRGKNDEKHPFDRMRFELELHRDSIQRKGLPFPLRTLDFDLRDIVCFQKLNLTTDSYIALQVNKNQKLLDDLRMQTTQWGRMIYNESDLLMNRFITAISLIF